MFTPGKPAEVTNYNTVINNEWYHNKTPSLKKYEYTPEVEKIIKFKLPEERVTSEIMTSYEYTQVISIRASQIEKGSKIFIKNYSDENPIEIAKKEIEQKKSPMMITRFLTEELGEIWAVNEMIPPNI